MSHILQIHPDDNVAVALEPLKAGEVVETSAGTVTLREDIPQGHKLALTDIPAGATVVKYGFPIGHATQAIHVGDWGPQPRSGHLPRRRGRYLGGHRRPDAISGPCLPHLSGLSPQGRRGHPQ